jgi:hypothetical protein
MRGEASTKDVVEAVDSNADAGRFHHGSFSTKRIGCREKPEQRLVPEPLRVFRCRFHENLA